MYGTSAQVRPPLTGHAIAVFAGIMTMAPLAAVADSQYSEKAIAVIQSCTDADISGFATLKERASSEGVKEVEVFMQVNGLGNSERAVHIHETASCEPCGSAGGHFDPGNFGMTNPDANHPYHSGDLVNIKSQGDSAIMQTVTSRITLTDGPLGLIDSDGSSFIVHDNPDSYCPEGEAAGCAGGSRAACGIILPVSTNDDFELYVSSSNRRRSAKELANSQLRGDVFIFLDPTDQSEPVRKVEFFVDGVFVKTEYVSPHDLNGTMSNKIARAFDTDNLSNGDHTASAIVYFDSGAKTFVSSHFKVHN